MTVLLAPILYALLGLAVNSWVHALARGYLDEELLQLLAFGVLALAVPVCTHRTARTLGWMLLLVVLRTVTSVGMWEIVFGNDAMWDGIIPNANRQAMYGAAVQRLYIMRWYKVAMMVVLGFWAFWPVAPPPPLPDAAAPVPPAPSPPAAALVPPPAVAPSARARASSPAVAPSAVRPHMGCMQLNNNYGQHCTSHYHAVRADDSHLVRARVCADYEREMLA